MGEEVGRALLGTQVATILSRAVIEVVAIAAAVVKNNKISNIYSIPILCQEFFYVPICSSQ